jgi:hypothetical protein
LTPAGDYFTLIAAVIEQGQREGTLRPDLPVKVATKARLAVAAGRKR